MVSKEDETADVDELAAWKQANKPHALFWIIYMYVGYNFAATHAHFEDKTTLTCHPILAITRGKKGITNPSDTRSQDPANNALNYATARDKYTKTA